MLCRDLPGRLPTVRHESWRPRFPWLTSEKIGGVIVAFIITFSLLGSLYGFYTPNSPPRFRVVYDLAAAVFSQQVDPSLSWRSSSPSESSAPVYPVESPPIQERARWTLVDLYGDAFLAHARDAVATLRVYGTEGELLGRGTAFRVKGSGTFMTNYHVVERAWSAELSFARPSGTPLPVNEVVLTDAINDLAVIRAASTTGPALELSHAPYPQKGQFICVVTSDRTRTYLEGNVLGSNYYGILASRGYIASTARTWHGTSGSPMLDENGFVVGINAAGTHSSEGKLSLAVPADRARRLLERVSDFTTPERVLVTPGRPIPIEDHPCYHVVLAAESQGDHETIRRFLGYLQKIRPDEKVLIEMQKRADGLQHRQPSPFSVLQRRKAS